MEFIHKNQRFYVTKTVLIYLTSTWWLFAISAATASSCPPISDCPVCTTTQAVCKLCPQNTSIPAQVTDLTILHGGCSSLERQGLLMAKVLSRYTALEKLSLNNVNVKHFFGSVFQTHGNLNVLHMTDNAIRSFDSRTFKGLGNLVELDMSRSHISLMAANTFKELISLKSLNLAGNMLSSLPDHVFDGLGVIESINLEGNPITSIVSAEFQNLTRVVNINLSHMNLSSVPSKLFSGLTSLRKLSLSGNNLPNIVVDALIGTSLDTLDLSDNKLTSLPSGAISRTATTPKTMNLSGNLIRSVSAAQMSGLEMDSLDLSGNPITFVASGAFAGSKIKVLDLSNTSLTSLLPSIRSSLTSSAIGSVHLAGNSRWRCDCTALWLGRYLLQDTLSSPPTCGANTKYAGLSLTAAVPQMESDCLTTTTTTTTTKTTPGLSVSPTVTHPNTHLNSSQAGAFNTPSAISTTSHLNHKGTQAAGSAVSSTASGQQSSVTGIGSAQATLSHSGSSQGPTQGPSQGTGHGLSQGIGQGQSQGTAHVPSHGTSHSLVNSSATTGIPGSINASLSQSTTQLLIHSPATSVASQKASLAQQAHPVMVDQSIDLVVVMVTVMTSLALALSLVGVMAACMLCKRSNRESQVEDFPQVLPPKSSMWTVTFAR